MSRTLKTLLTLAAAGVLAACGAVPASAFRGHTFGFAFGWGVKDGKPELETCTEACKPGLTGNGEGQFSKPTDVAVNEATGQVYVLDQGNGRIERFSSAGVFELSFDGSETPAKAFNLENESSGEIPKAPLFGGIAVDNSCSLRHLGEPACKESDPSYGDVYVTDPGHGVVDKFDPQGKYLNELQKSVGEQKIPGEAFKSESTNFKGEIELGYLYGVSVDQEGRVWVYYGNQAGDVADFTDAALNGKGVANTLISTHEIEGALGQPRPGFAVDSTGKVYVNKDRPPGAILQLYLENEAFWAPSLDPFCGAGPSSGVGVDLTSDEVFVDALTSVGACSAAGALQESFGSGDLVGGGGLAVRDEGHGLSSVFVADEGAERVDVFVPEPPGPPRVLGGSSAVSGVTGDSARFSAEVNPHGADTDFLFEYGRCGSLSSCAGAGYERAIPMAPGGVVGDDFEVHGVEAVAQGLAPGSVYHARVVAHNGDGEAIGEEVVFSTQPAGGFELLDGREWELVSPADRHGALIEPISQHGLVQAAASGDALAFTTFGPTQASPEGNTISVKIMSRRTASGWVSEDIETPFASVTGPTILTSDYRFFSSDLSASVVQPFGAFDRELSGEASEQTAFLRTDFASGEVERPCLPASGSCYRPLVSGCPGGSEACAKSVEEHADVPPGTVFGEEGQCPEAKPECGPEFLGATPDLSHVVLGAKAPLLAGAGENGLYEWTGGRLAQVDLLPGGGPATVSDEAQLGHVSRNVRGAVADGGARVAWSEQEGEHHLYVTDPFTGSTVMLDTPQARATGAEPVAPAFALATGEGSLVLFTDEQQLTEDAGSRQQNPDLYACEVVEVSGGLECRLSDLTPKRSGMSADVQGTVLGASENGDYVYLVAEGVLAQNTGANGEQARAGGDNLYELHREGATWTTSFIATLSGEDAPDWDGLSSFAADLESLTARVSSNGRWLAFMSDRSLDGQDDRDARSGKPDEQVYLYDAGQPFSRTNPVCVSCQPSGERPIGQEYQTLGAGGGAVSAVGGLEVWPSETLLAGSIPGWTPYANGRALYQSRYLSNEGRLFFNARDGLVPQDGNEQWDVYEYEPPGVGSCTVSTASYSERTGGCVDLISSGASDEEAGFLDASENGADVFFLSAAKLVSGEVESGASIYDAHTCTTSSPCLTGQPPSPAPCTTEAACRPAPTPQPEVFGAPASATFTGPGNLLLALTPAPAPVPVKVTKKARCRKGYVKNAKGRCVKAKRKGKATAAAHARRARS